MQAPSDCSMPCAGNSSEICGGSSRLSIYETAKTGLISSGSTPAVPGLVGCYAQGSVATAGNYLFLQGLQQRCHAGLVLLLQHWVQPSGSYSGYGCVQYVSQPLPVCDLKLTCRFSPCAGNSTDNCGSQQAGVVAQYTTAGVVAATAGKPTGYIGCFNDNPGARQLPGYSFTSSNMTNLVCATTCAGRGFALSGTQAGSEYLDRSSNDGD